MRVPPHRLFPVCAWRALAVPRPSAHDPGETRNVAAAHPAVAADFERYLEQAHTPSPHWPRK